MQCSVTVFYHLSPSLSLSFIYTYIFDIASRFFNFCLPLDVSPDESDSPPVHFKCLLCAMTLGISILIDMWYRQVPVIESVGMGEV